MDNTTTNSTVVLASAPMRVFGALTYGILSSLSILMNLLLIAVLAHGHAQFKRMAFFTLAWQMVLCDLMAQSIQLVVAVPVTFAGQAVYGHPGWYYALLFFDTVAYNATLLFSGLLTLSRVCIFFLPAVNQLLFSAGNIMFTVVGLWLFVLAFCCGYPIIGCRKAFSETGFYLYHDCPDPLSTFGIVYRQIAFALSTYLPILMLVAYVFCFIYIRYVFGPRRHHGSSVVGALNGDREEERIERARRQREKNFLIQYYEYQDLLQEFYRTDEERLGHSEFDHRVHQKAREDENEKRQRMDKLLARIVFCLNIVLLFANLAASIMSRSYSVISAFIDNSMDLMSSFIVQVHPEANLPTIGLLLGGIASKVLLMVVCYSKSSHGSRLLAMDLRNDVITSVVALGGAFLGDRFWPFADPIGAILVCTFIAISWFANVFSTIPMIVGKRAEQEQISRILRIAIQHDARIRALDHVMVYHLGERALVELHVVLDENLPLKVTHDLTEALDKKIRSLDFVERVFVHVDYQCDGDS